MNHNIKESLARFTRFAYDVIWALICFLFSVICLFAAIRIFNNAEKSFQFQTAIILTVASSILLWSGIRFSKLSLKFFRARKSIAVKDD